MTRTLRSVLALVLPAIIAAATTANAQDPATVNRGVVQLETAGTAGISVRIGEELATLIDDGATRRLVPVVGKGALQNLIDLKYLRGIDMAILPADLLDYARERKLIAAADPGAYYITKLYNEEFHVLTRRDITSVAELANRKVNIGPQGSGTAITAARVFEQLHIPVIVTNEPQEVALEALRKGDIAAVALLAGKPAPLVQDLKDPELRLLDVPFNKLTSEVYVPTQLTAADYPALLTANQPVKTIAVGAVLAVAELRQVPERNRNVANFVETFFTGFQSLLAPGRHPKWHEVNLAAELPGWRRYPPAEQWLQRNLQIAKAPSVDELRLMFSRFLDERRQAAGEAPLPTQEKSALFQQFRAWQTGQVQ